MIKEEIVAWLVSRIHDVCGAPPSAVSPHETFTRHGLDSLTLTRILGDLSELVGRALPPTLAWEYSSIESLSAYLADNGDQSDAEMPLGPDRFQAASDEPIAIVGMACRFPGAPNVEAFWKMLCEGRDAITEVPKDRWNVDEFYDEDPNARGKMRTKWGGFLERVDEFDTKFFGISPRETIQMDPRQRLSLELAWEALEAAGVSPASLTGSNTAVFMGALFNEYMLLQNGLGPHAVTTHTSTGGTSCMIANRISYALGLMGASMTVETACSSALVAVQLACSSLRRGETNLALAGGVNLLLHPETTLGLDRLGTMSPTGRCKAFDASADGYVRSEGAGVVVLKRLRDAIADGDQIFCIIRGSAVNNDGPSNGLTAPNPAAQRLLMTQACRNAGIDPASVHYVEAHGTGTSLGDPIEAHGLGAVYGAERSPAEPLRIGSVKTNIGHSEAAAGMAGLIKTALILERGVIPPSLHFETPNPLIDFDALRIRVASALESWPDDGKPRRAGVSSYGYGGTGAHVILEGISSPRATVPATTNAPARGVAWVFSGQGSVWSGMGRDLLLEQPVFRAAISRCDAVLRRHIDVSILDELYYGLSPVRFERIDVTWPLLFAFQVSLAALWRSRGLEPTIVLGHSIGEVAAAHIAGALSLDDAARVICHQAKLVQQTVDNGAMAFVALDWAKAEERVAHYGDRVTCAIAASPSGTVISGDALLVGDVVEQLQKEGVFARLVATKAAVHSSQMDDARRILPSLIAGIRPRKTTVPIISSMTGQSIEGDNLDAEYWADQLRVPVLFKQAIEHVLTSNAELSFLELSPHPIVQAAIRECMQARGHGPANAVVASLVRSEPSEKAFDTAIQDLCKLGVIFGSPKEAEARAIVLPLSAKTPEALIALAESYQEWFAQHDEPLHHVAYTASVRRSHLDERLAVVGANKEEIADALGAFAAGEAPKAVVTGKLGQRPPKVVFVFSGQGSQWVGMGRQLYREEPKFQSALLECDEAIRKEAAFSVIEELEKSEETSRLHETIVAQPVLFAVEVALAALLQSWGIVPSAVLGHSVGEIAAAHVAGKLDLAQAARLVSVRARVMQKATGNGKMVSVSLDEKAAENAIAGMEDRIGIAAVNDPSSVVLSGDTGAIDTIVERLSSSGVQTRPLRVNYAFHSPQMEPLLAEFQQDLGDFIGKSGNMPMISTVTGKSLGDERLDAAYWTKNIRQTVRFAEAITSIASSERHLFVEVGPHPVLAVSMEQTLAAQNVEGKIIPTLRRDKDERKGALGALGALFVHGSAVDWTAIFPDGGRVVSLPAYPWQKQRYWLDTTPRLHRAGVSTGHPLLGEAISVAGTDAVFETILDPKSLAWLEDHRVFGEVIVPGAALVEMARAAGSRFLTAAHCRISGFTIQSPLRFGPHDARRVQVILQKTDDDIEVRIYSREIAAEDGQTWTLHARGVVDESEGQPALTMDLAALRERMPTAPSIADVYAHFSQLGLDYGSTFQAMKELRLGDNEAVSHVELPAEPSPEGYGIHPALLDAALQTLIVAHEVLPGYTYLPFEFGEVRFFETAPREAWVHARIEHGEVNQSETLPGTILFARENGRVFASLSDVRLKLANAEATRRSWDAATTSKHLYRVEWHPLPLPESLPISNDPWLIIGKSSDFARELQQQFVSSGIPCSHCPIEQLSNLSKSSLAGLIYVSDDDEVHHGSIPKHAEEVTTSALQAVQALVRANVSTRLHFVTRGAVAPGETVSLAGASLWGFGRVVKNEHPELRCKLVDVGAGDELAASFHEFFATDDESEVVWRNGKRLVARLAKATFPNGIRIPSGESHALAISKKGELSNLFLERVARRAPGAGEIEIEVHASGLNFRDVLNALGMYPGDAGPLGNECSGIVVAVGESVNDIVVGDRVMALVPGAFRSFVTVDARLAALVPRDLTLAQAATIPLVFLTAWYALHDLGELKPGERILVHAAAGGVGMAAVQIAKRLGAEVLGTASPSKWDVVRKMGVQHVANSRTVEFAYTFRNATEGRGVDVVLNSLAGEFIDESWALLAPGGRFLEMGKTDIRASDVLEVNHPGRRYRAFDLMDVGPDRIHEMLHAIVDGFEARELTPLPVHGFALTEAEEAFRYMAQARHVGKIVLRAAPRKTEDATVLVTGGLGALGMHVARFLWNEHRIARIVLVSRSAPTDEKLAEIAALRAEGADVKVLRADLSDAYAALYTVASLPADRPLRGIIHAAGVLDDGMIADQTPERFAKVFAPKVHGAWNLHQATRKLPLDFFVMFSSVSSPLGNAGQSNYAAANAFMDALAHVRRAEGLPAQTLQWSAWADGGMATTLSAALQARFSRMGLDSLQPARALSLLDEALGRSDGELFLAEINQRALEQAWNHDVPPLWRGLIAPKRHDGSRSEKGHWRDKLATLDAPAREAEVSAALRSDIAKVLSFGSASDIPDERPLRELGLDSLMAVELRNAISARVGKPLPATLLFDHPTVKALRQYLFEKVLVFEASTPVAIQPVKTISRMAESIAIIGVGCRFPGGVRDPEGFWQLLENEVDAIREVPRERWDVDSYYDPNPDAPGKMTTRWGGFVEHIDHFDPEFFGVSPREAQSLDPQQRLLLETTWEALERAGIPAERLMGSDTGVYVGICHNEYQQHTMGSIEDIDAYSLLGTTHSAIVGRISYWLGLQGPNMPVHTACSSSLVSVHLACQALRSGECSMALAGGVNLVLSPEGTVYFSRLKAVSPTGRCHTFSADADGYVRAEGCAMIVLKRLSDALRDGDSIVALIRGSAINQDGRSQGLTAPNGPAQEAVIRKALAVAGVKPADVDYVEAHGTGTPLGDPIEVQALASVLGEGRSIDKPLIIGSVKTNIGHTEAAAGIAGLLKGALSLARDTIPRSLHFTSPNPHIAWSHLPVKVAAERIPWIQNGKSRVAGVSSFGFSGTNAHIILEEAPRPVEKRLLRASSYLLPLSAKTPEALTAMAQSYAKWLSTSNEPLHDIAYTASVRRSQMEHRLSVVGSSKEEIAAALGEFATGAMPPNVVAGKASSTELKVIFVFPGQGSQWVGMGRVLQQEEKAFRDALAACDEAIRKEAAFSVLEELNKKDEASRLSEIDVVQPVLFAVEVALAALWRSWGVEPSAVVGHSMGEVAAAYIAGALSLDDAAAIICRRSRLLRQVSGQGAMALVELTLQGAETTLVEYENRLSVAVSNGPRSTVIAGDPAALEEVLSKLERDGVFCQRIKTDVASHSPQMEPLLADVVASLSEVEPKELRIPMRSTVTGQRLCGDELAATYWADNLRKPVLFSQVVHQWINDGHTVFLEMSPHPVLLPFVDENLQTQKKSGLVLASLRYGRSERMTMLSSLGTLHAHGGRVDWNALFPAGGHVAPLPTYPWRRERYWIERAHQAKSVVQTYERRLEHPLLGAPSSTLADERIWQRFLSVAAIPWLAEHRVQNAVVFPGAGYVECALEAAKASYGTEQVLLEDVAFEQMLVFEQEREARVALIDDGEGYVFRISSRSENSAWTQHASGRVRSAATVAEHSIETAHDIAARLSREIDVASFYQAMRDREMYHGPPFQGIVEMRSGELEVLARIRLPENVDDEGYLLHPALLDAFFQVSAAALVSSAEMGTYVPVGISRLHVYERPGRESWVRATKSPNTPSGWDLRVVNAQGNVLVAIDGLTLQRLERVARSTDPLANCVYDVAWQKVEWAPPSFADGEVWLVFEDRAGFGNVLVEQLTKQERNCIRVLPGSSFERLAANAIRIDFSRPDDYSRLLRETFGKNSPCDRVVHLPSLNVTPLEHTTTASLSADLVHASVSATYVAQAIVRHGFRTSPQLFLVTRGAQSVNGSDPVSVSQAPILGLGKIMAMEHPELRCTRIDLPAEKSDQDAEWLLRELTSHDNEDEIALRGVTSVEARFSGSDLLQGQTRYVARLVRGKLEAVEDRVGPIRNDRTYLLTGGLGGLGLSLAQWLVEQGARSLVLVGRKGPTNAALDVLQTLEQAGARVLCAQADVSRDEDVEKLFVMMQGELPPLGGIVHAAMVLDDHTVLEQSEESFQKAFAPKALGAWNLHQYSAASSLDFFVMYSSAAGLVGSPGQSNYCAANAFLDALSHERVRRGLCAMSIQWGTFAEVGLAAVADNRGKRLGDRGISSITPSEGHHALARLLQHPRPVAGIMRFDARRWTAFYPAAQRSPYFAELLSDSQSVRGENVRGGKTVPGDFRKQWYACPENERMTRLEEFLVHHAAQVLRLNPSRIGRESSLPSLGLDSLMSLELRNRIEQGIGLSLPAMLFLQEGSPHKIASYLSERLAPVSVENSDSDAARESNTTLPSSIPSVVPAPDDRYLPFPLTDIQQSYLLSSVFMEDGESRGCLLHMEFDCIDLDVPRLEAAWNRLIEYHDMLRAVAPPDGRQQISSEVPWYTIEVQDLSGQSPEKVQAELDALRDGLVNSEYTTEAWPLFLVHGARLDERRTRIYFRIDLLIADAASIMQLSLEWRRLYENPDIRLQKPTLSFRDYVLAEASFDKSEMMQASQAYWQKRIPDLPGAPAVPFVPLPAGMVPVWGRRQGRLDAETWQRFKLRAARAEMTTTGLLGAAFAEVLAAWSRNSRFCINMTMFRRLPVHPEVKDIIGDFTSTLLVEVDMTPGTFRDRSRRFRDRLAEDLNHFYFSGVRVMQEVNRTRAEKNINPYVFTSMLGLHAEKEADDLLLEWLGQNAYTITQTPYVWLDYQVYERGGELHFNWDVVEARFPERMIDDMFSSYSKLLCRLADEDECWDTPCINLVPVPAAQLDVRAEVNATEAPISTELLHTLFEKQAEQRPKDWAVISSSKRLTYGELRRRVHQVGHRLRREGVRPGELVAVVMQKGWEQVVAVLGILASGAAYMPVDPTVPADRLQYMLDNGGATWVLTQSWLDVSLVWPERVRRLSVDQDEPWSGVEDGALSNQQTPEDLAYVIFTSGSTGFPKGVMIDHRGAVNTILDINQRFQVGPGDRVLAVSSLNFDLSVYDVFGLLAAGGAIVFPDDVGRVDPAHWTEMMMRERVTLWNTVPALMEMWVEHAALRPEVHCDDLRLVLLSGDWIPVTLPGRIAKLAADRMSTSRPRVISLGGATEASIWSNLFPIEEVNPAWKSIPYGRPMLNQRFHVLDETLEPCPVWVPGYLYIGGIGLARGYWRDTEKTAASFIIHPRTGERLYRTGDLGRYLPDGNLEFLGRQDTQVKMGGHRIELGEIETVLGQHPGVQNAAVVVHHDPQSGKRLVAHVVPKDKQIGMAASKSADAPALHLKSSSSTDGMLVDPAERLSFKLKRHGLRLPRTNEVTIPLHNSDIDESLIRKYEERATQREFVPEPISLTQLGSFLESLREIQKDERPRRRHASAGALYPVQVYLHVKEGRVEGLAGGIYYHHPLAHHLVQITARAEIDRSVHAPDNQSAYDSAAFSIFLVAQMNAITPLYGSLAKDLCMLEAGYIGQLLMSVAHESELGLCAIGGLQFDSIRHMFALDDGHVLLHSLVGGRPSTAEPVAAKAEPAGAFEERLRSFLSTKLPEYMVPAAIVLLEALPVTSNGKVDRKALASRPVHWKEKEQFVAPRDNLEEKLSAIVADVLGVERISTQQNFFEAGITSVLLIRVANRVRQDLGREIGIVELFSNPTIASLAARLGEVHEETAEVDNALARAKARRKLLFRR